MKVFDRLSDMSVEARKLIYISAWNEFTIAGRVIMDNPDLSSKEQLLAMQWLNEAQHRLYSAYNGSECYKLEDFYIDLSQCVETAPVLGPLITYAFQRAIDKFDS